MADSKTSMAHYTVTVTVHVTVARKPTVAPEKLQWLSVQALDPDEYQACAGCELCARTD
tara:strand:- start:1159 stop:1335 length:177 start_codon:yes stop_codon:yes gene_type:complete